MKKINKTTARKLYNQGAEFWITACNMRPECGILINPETPYEFENFDQLYNSFSYYNCNPETGRYPAFYINEN